MTADESTAETDTEREYPEFSTERLTLDVGMATELAHETLNGLTDTETDEGRKFRTMDGTLIAILSEAEGEGVELHYRTAPESHPGTLKARKLRRALAT